jgi:deoxycytidylate deaminase
MTKKEEALFRAAKSVAELSDHKQHKIGAVVVLKHRIISSGFNKCAKTHPLQKKYNKYRFTEDSVHTCHAELSALLPLIKDGVNLSDASVYVHREHKNGMLAMARPCKSCMELIKDCGIKRVFYTTENGYAQEYLKL